MKNRVCHASGTAAVQKKQPSQAVFFMSFYKAFNTRQRLGNLLDRVGVRAADKALAAFAEGIARHDRDLFLLQKPLTKLVRAVAVLLIHGNT